MKRYERAGAIFLALAKNCTSSDPADDKSHLEIERMLVGLSDSDFELIGDVVELFNTEPGKRLMEGSMDRVNASFKKVRSQRTAGLN